ncbi:MAG TPA: LysR family transcriptional regulator [Pseudolysinimonas sp.]|nr:LysR family transcriptional regulator [Pseudolysinimonas sp.]
MTSTVGFTLTQLQYFCLVAELGSFSAAARAQHVSANTVVFAVNTLEGSLGTQLCVRRRSRGIELTLNGQMLYEQARDLLDRAEKIYVSVASENSPAGPISLGCTPMLEATVLTRLADAFATRHPNSGLALSVRPQETLIEELISGELDCAILYDIEVPTALSTRELYRRPAHVVISRRHSLAGHKSINLRQLAQDPLILFDANPLKGYTLRIITEAGMIPNVRYEVSDYEVMRALVARNLGYCVTILDTFVDRSETAKTIVGIPIAPKTPEVGIVIAWSVTSGSDARVREMVDLATQNAARPNLR